MNDIVPEHKRRLSIEAIAIICIILFFFAIAIIAGCWYTFGFIPTFIGMLSVILLVGLWLFIKRIDIHILDRQDRKLEQRERIHKMDLSTIAVNNFGHSLQWEQTSGEVTRKIILTSPLTIPNAPVTIKELNMSGLEQEPPALPPPSQPSMDEMYSAVRYNALEVAFGKTVRTGETVVQGIIPGVHFKLVGGSGFGKSCLAAALLDIATKRNDPDHLRIALLDLEYKTSRLFEHLPHVLEVNNGTRRMLLHAKDADEVARHLTFLRKELDRRAARQGQVPLLLIYVEEMLSLQYEVDERLRDQMLADLAILALRGRKYGMFLLACTQTDYSTKELREAQRQFRTRSGFAVDPSAARAAGFVNNELVKYNFQNAKPGQFLLEKPAFSELVLAPLYDVEQKLEEMSNPSRQYVTGSLAASQSIPSQFPVMLEQTGNWVGNHAGKQREADMEKIALMREMIGQHKGQNEIIEIVLPGMRNADAIMEYRRLLALLVESEA